MLCDLLAVTLGVAGEEMRGKGRDVFAALTQGRQVNLDRIEAEEEFRAEVLAFDFGADVGVGGRDDADVDAAWSAKSRRAPARRFRARAGAWPAAQGHVGDFVEEQRAAVGVLEAADASVRASVNAPLTWPKSSLSKVPSGSAPALTATMEREAREAERGGSARRFLAGAVLAGDEDAGVGGSDAGDGGEDRLHGGRGGDHLREALGAEEAILGFEAISAADGVVEIDLGAQDGKQAGVVPGLLDEVVGAAAHGFDGELYVGPGGHDDDGELGLVGANLGRRSRPSRPEVVSRV